MPPPRRNRLQSAAQRNHGSSSTARNHKDDILTDLPEYEPLSCPLSTEATRALAELSSAKDTRKYEEHLNNSLKLLSASVRDLNDKYVARKDNLRSLQEKRGENGEKSDRERAEEKALLALKDDVPQLTDECDLAVRSVIDLKVEVEDNRGAMQRMVEKIESENIALGQRARDDDEDADMADVDITVPLSVLKHETEQAAADYAVKSLYEKYGVNNDYIGFKRLWHDAVHGSDGKPLPDASRWFTENEGGGGQDDDEDLIVAEEHFDIHCPLSMAVMEDPYTSVNCKHTFEKTSIVQFLRGVRGGKAQCPQTGCNKEVSLDDFLPDPVVLRRIKRQLETQRASNSDDDDEVDGEDGFDVNDDSSMAITSARATNAGRRNRDRGPQSTQDIDDTDTED
ncbi:zinc-finger of the MIZ type in Nse subunit-domain-containing protein [Durotheca rogersii]|uniref:zinc-finger of the MIZ type in Nse subunit-domain-containing protein n=1 Tax=Durotheca rogersii TaxID=419775 RepID=UPI00221F79A8|nr:zinc-finger of the MIZ type in Nse subunit-domain-containing protein [Durotheca rogersii]KAI5866153.1 zinc-finger of the MIZ type in Nse subunit-domain-containing protein [Durotheca rogersii]